MASDTYSSILGVLLQGTGNNNNSWGDNANNSVFKILERAIAGTATNAGLTGGTLDLSGSPPPTAATQVLDLIQTFTGTLVSQQVVQIPNLSKTMLVYNGTTGSYSLGIKTSSGSTCYVRQGSWALVWCDGSNGVYKRYMSGASAPAGKFAFGATPVVGEGEVECNGTAYSRTSDKIDLFTALTIQQTGTRASTGNGVITALSSTANMKVGYYVSGTGIAASATIASVDSSTQITLSGNNTSTGSGTTVIVSPYPLGDGSTTFNVPTTNDTGRFPRSRTSSVAIGTNQASAIKNHVHAATGLTATTALSGSVDANGGHNHTGQTGVNSVDHTHAGAVASSTTGAAGGPSGSYFWDGASHSTGGQSAQHVHDFTTNSVSNHQHGVTGVSAVTTMGGSTANNTSGDSTETRPESFVALTTIVY